MLFPGATSDQRRTTVELALLTDRLPVVTWCGLGGSDLAGEAVPPVPGGPGMPLLGEHAHGLFTRPHLRGHRLDGSAWSTRFGTDDVTVDGNRLVLTAHDPGAGLAMRTEVESLVGGALRMRHHLTNDGPDDYLLEGLEVVLPVPDHLVEVLDLTGRHERERSPQRHGVADGVWRREGRGGRPGLDAATMVVLGTEGFSTTRGEVLGVHVAHSGNSVLRVERGAASGTTAGGGELLLPGEVVLAPGTTYATPWVVFGAAEDGLDGLAASWHTWQRSLPAHPSSVWPGGQPVVLNVWEAVFFDHDLDRLKAIADRAARVGVELFVLDDGWFRGRRDDRAGLGDWWVDEAVWPAEQGGLGPLVEHVRGLGMGFGLWFEPEMVNPDSDLFREHPDWVLAVGDRLPLEERYQQVLDLTRPEAWQHVFDRMDAVLSAYPVDYVKWDHNRDLLEAGSSTRGGAAAARDQDAAYHRLMDALRAAHPGVAWESCASGGGRIDLSLVEKVQRFWTSDMTDALARQQIQRWTTQLIAPEYAGAHVSSPTSHTTGRTLSLDFRAATALFGSFGIEWDLSSASEDELASLAGWVTLYRDLRGLLHSGRVVRPESSDPTVLLHGVVASDRSEALVAHVQLDESAHNRGVWVRVPGLDPAASYSLAWEGPVTLSKVSKSADLHPDGPTAGLPRTGADLASRGFWRPRRRPETVTLVRVSVVAAP